MASNAYIEERIELWSMLVERAEEELDDAKTELARWMAETPDPD